MNDAEAIIVVDLAFGDCGKGTIVDFLVREHAADDSPLVVRFNGGPQAGHNVVTPAPDDRHHTFAQFGSGTFVPGVRTLLSRFMLIEPYALINEERHLRELGVAHALERLSIHEDCIVITPPQQAANRLRELSRASDAHGTCGVGLGEAMADSIAHPELLLRARELGDRAAVEMKLEELRSLKYRQLRDAMEALQQIPQAQQSIETLWNDAWIDAACENYAWIAERVEIIDEEASRELIRTSRLVIFEGAQGVLLDEDFGFHPHTTWSNCTFANAERLLDDGAFPGHRTRLGALRSHFTRHGPGPFVTDDPTLPEKLPEPHNDARGWQGGFRVGAFDAVAARYALAVAGGVDAIALTHLDRLASLPPQICTAYECDGEVARDIPIHRPSDLARQEELTRWLRRCRPVYTPIDTSDPERFIAAIERELDVRVSITSHGPTAAEKRRRIVSP